MSRAPIELEVDAALRRRFTAPLLKWYDGSGRNLPWRMTDDPYRIWVSEIMLQQTQVATVLPYYHRFLEAFPTIKALASADLETVLKLWQGLGYYARARHLHRAAQTLLSRYAGKMPKSFDAVYALPGIGRSTAGAILTIAHGKRHPILDGNVRRVLCRFFAIEEDPREKSVEAALWHCSEQLMPRRNPSRYLQAIMDLGATVCTPRQPDCPHCPLQKPCAARKQGLTDRLPVKAVSKKVLHFDYFAGVLRVDDFVLIRRRPLQGLLAGLWEFPGARVDPHEKKGAVMTAYEKFFRETLALNVRGSHLFMEIPHAFTHFKMTLHVFSFRLKKRFQTGGPMMWVERESLAAHPFSSAHQKIVLQLCQSPDRPRLFV